MIVAVTHSNYDVLDQFWHVSVFGFAKTCKNRQMPQDSQRYHFCALWCKKQPCALGRLCDIPIYPCDALATFSVFGFRQFATHSSYFHPLPANFPAWVCSVRNVHSGCCGTAWSCFPGVLSSSPEALSLGSSSQSAAFMFQRSQAP